MKNENILKELFNKIFGTGELYDDLYNVIEKAESESLEPDNNNFYQIYYDPQEETFDTFEYADFGSYPACDRLIHIISISNQYNDEFYGDIEINEDWTIKDCINEVISDIVYTDMEKVETELKNRLALN